MAERPAYVILGRGRWAKRMLPIIAGEGRKVGSIEETRRQSSESEATYISRFAEEMTASAAQIAWLCVTPGPHVTLMIQAAMDAGLHVVLEKPWYGTEEDTRRLETLARVRGRVIAVHYEYCVLEEVEKCRREFYPGTGLHFGGRFFLERPGHRGIPALDNLGSHLLAIREWAVPSSEVSQVQCKYEMPDERSVWIERGGQKILAIDLLNHTQQIVQRFMEKVELSLDGATFPFNLEFAMHVANGLNNLRSRK